MSNEISTASHDYNLMNNLASTEDLIENIQIITPNGMFGPDKDYLVDSIIRAIAEHHGHENEWPIKYGTTIDNNIFMMHSFCWCEKEDCPWCKEEDPLPNFHYKPLDFQVGWYKYIGRSMKYNKNISIFECANMLIDCLNTKNK
jgi:hypothetical protein